LSSAGGNEFTIYTGSQVPRPLRRHFSVDQWDALAAAFVSGVRQRDLAIQYGISVRSVKRLIHQGRITQRIGHSRP
jgi:hypothetical protein